MKIVKSLVSKNAQEDWDYFIEKKGAAEARRDFGRGLTESPYASREGVIQVR